MRDHAEVLVTNTVVSVHVLLQGNKSDPMTPTESVFSLSFFKKKL